MVGSSIIRLGDERGIGQGELLSKIQLQGIDMNQAKLSRIEGQKISVMDQDLYAIAQALDVPVDSLFVANDDKKQL